MQHQHALETMEAMTHPGPFACLCLVCSSLSWPCWRPLQLLCGCRVITSTFDPGSHALGLENASCIAGKPGRIVFESQPIGSPGLCSSCQMYDIALPLQ